MHARERFDGLLQGQPLHCLDLVSQLPHRTTDGSHMPELYDFDLAVDGIRHRAEKFMNRNLMSGFLHPLSFGGVEGALAWIELAFRQDPRLVPSQSHDGDARLAAFPKNDSPRSQNRHAALYRISHVKCSA